MKLACAIPHFVTVAVSGGVDSMSALHFVTRNRRRHVQAVFCHHGTLASDAAYPLVRMHCASEGIELLTYNITDYKARDKRKSLEEYWREFRIWAFLQCPYPVLAAHHLDDCIETYLFNAINGREALIPVANPSTNVIRPFLLTPRKTIEAYAERHNLKWIHDQSNNDDRYMRNYIRQHIVPRAMEVNQGLHKTIARKIRATLKDPSIPLG